MNILCCIGFHKFPKQSDFDWVVCGRHCCTEKNLKTKQIHKMGI